MFRGAQLAGGLSSCILVLQSFQSSTPCTQSISHDGEEGRVPGKPGDIAWELPSGQAGDLIETLE